MGRGKKPKSASNERLPTTKRELSRASFDGADGKVVELYSERVWLIDFGPALEQEERRDAPEPGSQPRESAGGDK